MKDNFAHDMIRYDIETLEPMQGVVVIDAEGEFTLLYEPIKDPLLQRCFEYRSLLPPSPSTSPTLPAALNKVPFLRSAYKNLPFAPNLSKPDFIPSKAVLFLERLRAKLPSHRLLVADFSSLPDTVTGRNGPVVQTRVRQEMVPCETFLVKQGYFDIFFPTGQFPDTVSCHKLTSRLSTPQRYLFSHYELPTGGSGEYEPTMVCSV